MSIYHINSVDWALGVAGSLPEAPHEQVTPLWVALLAEPRLLMQKKLSIPEVIAIQSKVQLKVQVF